MILAPDTLPNDPELLKQMLLEAIDKRQSDQHTIQVLQEQVALLRQRLFGRKSEQSVDPQSPQLAMFNEAASLLKHRPKRTKRSSPLSRSRSVASASRCRPNCHASRSSMNCPSTN